MDIKEYSKFVYEVCKRKDWVKDWSQGGCYAHLELSEFIEAVRGKGDPIEELGDVLFTVLAIADYYNIDPEEAIKNSVEKHSMVLQTSN